MVSAARAKNLTCERQLETFVLRCECWSSWEQLGKEGCTMLGSVNTPSYEPCPLLHLKNSLFCITKKEEVGTNLYG